MSLDYDFDRAERQEKRRHIIFATVGWVVSIGLAITLAWMISAFALEKTNVVGNSMNITLEADDRILINKLAYKFDKPERFDVVVFKKDGKEHSYYCVSRVIGLPGEKVRIAEGKVYINDEFLDEPMIVDDILIEGLASENMLLDEDEYFVLGDNRNNSEDSRFTNVGNVVFDEIIGKAWLRTNKFAFVNKLNMNDKVTEEDSETEDAESGNMEE